MQQNNNMYDNYYKINPYENFPYNYTKNGQKQIKENLENGYIMNNNYNLNNNNYSNFNNNENQNNNSTNSNFNLAQFLPLLLKNNGNNNEVIQSLIKNIPQANNNNNNNDYIKLISTLMQNKQGKQKNNVTIKETENSYIDKLEKI